MELVVWADTLISPEKESINQFAGELMTLTQRLADELYFIDAITDSKNVKFREWAEAASEYQNSRTIPDFIYARYGYAVEEYVNLSLLSKRISPPRGYKIKLQVTHGKTRPDIVILNQNEEEIAWLDITSESSIGHIRYKSGNWETARSYVAELLYDDLDVSRITKGGTIASHAAPRIARAAKQMNSRLMRHLAECMNEILKGVKIGDTICERDFPRFAAAVEAKFGVSFAPNLKHSIILSMLKMYVDLPRIKYPDRATKWIRAYEYNKTGQNKSKAMSYITDSYNLHEKFAFISGDDSVDRDDSDSSGEYIPDASDSGDSDKLDFEAYCDELAVAGRQSDEPFDPKKFFDEEIDFI